MKHIFLVIVLHQRGGRGGGPQPREAAERRPAVWLPIPYKILQTLSRPPETVGSHLQLPPR